MRVLVVSYSAPPLSGPRSIRAASITRALLRAGHEVEILSSATRDGDDLLLTRVAGARRIQLSGGLMSWARARRKQRRGTGGEPPRAERWARAAVPLMTTLMFPDRDAEFLLAYAVGRVDITPPDLVLSVVLPFSGAVLGAWIARRHGAAHVIDYGDPWAHYVLRREPDRPAWCAHVDLALERRIVKGTAGIVMTTESQAEAMRRWFPGVARVTTFTNGFEPDDYTPGVIADPELLRHVGQLYAARLPIGPFAEALAESPVFSRRENVGPVDGVTLPTSMTALPSVPYRVALRMNQEAGALMAIGTTGGLQIPSKVFHALGAGRPLLMIAAPGDPLETLNLGEQLVLVANDTPSVRRGLDRLRERSGTVFRPPEAFNWATLGPRYVSFLESCR